MASPPPLASTVHDDGELTLPRQGVPLGGLRGPNGCRPPPAPLPTSADAACFVVEGARMVCLCCNDDDVGHPERHATGKKHQGRIVGYTERKSRGQVSLPPAGEPLNLSEAMKAAVVLRKEKQTRKRRRAEEHHASLREGLDGV
jgi:hypothetical protein